LVLILIKSKHIYFVAEATCKSQPNAGREKGKGKSVSFAMSDASGVVTPTNSEMDNFRDSYNDKLTDENLSNLSQQTVQKVSAFDSA
jgi:transcription factor TFIIIB component B''